MPTKHSPREALELMLGHLGFAFEIKEEQRPAGPVLHVRTRTPAKLIGREGKTLEDLQFLLNRVLSNREEETPKIVIDVEGYKLRHQETLLEELDRCVEEALRTNEPVQMPPMNSFDRRIIHLACKEKHPDIETSSVETQGRLKCIIVRAKSTKQP